MKKIIGYILVTLVFLGAIFVVHSNKRVEETPPGEERRHRTLRILRRIRGKKREIKIN